MDTAADPVERDRRPDGQDLDPEIRHFVDTINAELAQRAGGRPLSIAETRAIAEQVRARWAAGGPRMASEIELPAAAEHVRLRIYDPGTLRPSPALVYLHGGGWTLFSLDTHDRVMREYADRAGITVVGVDYALSPEAKFPVALDQVVAVCRWLAVQGATLGIDASRLSLGGDSAGANLALSAALELRDAGEAGTLRALLLNYGAFARRSSATARRAYGGDGYMLASAEMEQFWRNYLRDETDALNPLACPLLADLGGLPPVFLAIPECDLLAEQSVALADALEAAGVDCEAALYKGASHSFLEAVSIAGVSDRALAEASAWLRERLSALA